ncbi:MAG: PEGA domain-containing protein [Deltaproteobacteria bacterium]|nr:PEGA domain-containing protein [Deltaproteobacteria bacterium]
MRRIAAWALALIAALALASPARADDDEARAEFARGAELVKQAKWAEALGAFERSHAKRPHPVTLFDIAACERALGSYTRARRTLHEAQALDAAGTHGNLPSATREDVAAFLGEIEAVLVTVDVHLDPPSATISVDGRPLEITAQGEVPTLTAGLAPPGPGRAPPAATFRLELDPGAHVVVLSRPGFADVVRRETFARGEPQRLDLVLARLDGTLVVDAERDRAAVSVDGVDVGLAPVTLKRPAGRYHVIVRKAGFVSFETDAVLEAGGRVGISARLPPESEPITKSWWFWATAGGVIATATVTTYFLTRPDPERPTANGGGLGWVLRTP